PISFVGAARERSPCPTRRSSDLSFDDAGFFRQGLVPFPAPEAGVDELATVHSASYLAFLRELDVRGKGLVDGRQTPAYPGMVFRDRKSTRLNSSHGSIPSPVCCL